MTSIPISTIESESAKASDVEQKAGHGGNMHEGTEAIASPVATDVVGSSGHIPRLEEINPTALDRHTGSPGADADQDAARSQS